MTTVVAVAAVASVSASATETDGRERTVVRVKSPLSEEAGSSF